MDDNKVYVVRCPDYEHAGEKIIELIDMMGGIGQFVSPGEMIALKVNLLCAARPEETITTHPAVAAGVARMVREAGARPFIIDSPGAGYRHTRKTLDKLHRKCGMYDAAKEAGCEVNLDTAYERVFYPAGKLIQSFEIISPILASDGVFNLCKMKTHLYTMMTGAVKNMFGVIPGLTKPGYHAKLHDVRHFAAMLLDLATYVSPRISLMDAVMAMEGDGPAAGSPRHVGLLIAARSPLALDVVATTLMGFRREFNPVLVEAEKRGLHPHRIEEVKIVGIELTEVIVPDFAPPSSLDSESGFVGIPLWQRILSPLFKNILSVQPHIIRDKCIACGICRDACPMKVITIENGKFAHINEQGCIRCYCCHELCPEHAVELRRSMLYRLVNRE